MLDAPSLKDGSGLYIVRQQPIERGWKLQATSNSLSEHSLVVRHPNKVAARAELIEPVRLVGFDD
jgi:hypothetical protein